MMDYYPKKTPLPRDIYNRVLWLVRGYDRMAEEVEAMVTKSKTDEPTGGGGTSDPTATAAARRERTRADIKAIDDALKTVPEEYREVVFKSIKDRRPMRSFPAYDYAAQKTWSTWRLRFIYRVAVNKGWWA